MPEPCWPSRGLLWAASSAQTSGPNRSSNGARVQHVIVRGSGSAMEVEIQTSGAPVAPDAQAITGPDRIVVDFPGALPAAELRASKSIGARSKEFAPDYFLTTLRLRASCLIWWSRSPIGSRPFRMRLWLS